MRCMNCGLPLSPTRTLSNCPRCGTALNTGQEVEQQSFGQAGWGGMGTTPQYNAWGQEVSNNPYQPLNQQWQQNQFGAMPGQVSDTPGSMRSSGLPQASFPPRRPSAPAPKKPGAGIKIALAGLITATLLLAIIAVLGFTHLGKASPNTPTTVANAPTSTQAATSPTTASASPTAAASATATGTPYPAQQYIDGAQMITDPTTAQPTTTFTVGSRMYVTFNVHPPSQGGEVCIYWFLNSKQLIDAPTTIIASPPGHTSHAYASYNNGGPAYVELYWASDATCADKTLAQHVDFTVTT